MTIKHILDNSFYRPSARPFLTAEIYFGMFSRVFYLFFPLFSLALSFLHPLRSGRSIPAKGFWEALLASQQGRTTIAATRHVPWALNAS